MSSLIGFNITPDSGTSLRKVLKYNLEPYLDNIEAISVAASKVSNVQIFILITQMCVYKRINSLHVELLCLC